MHSRAAQQQSPECISRPNWNISGSISLGFASNELGLSLVFYSIYIVKSLLAKLNYFA